ncbi:MAG: metal ABC transporter substrate-binding protein [candidate division WOR-3 bacterium]
MAISRRAVFYRLVLTLTFFLLAAGCRHKAPARIKVVATTSLISSIVSAVGGERVAVTTLAPPGFCPGHFDLQPSALVAANEARLILNHGWEGWFAKLKEQLRNPGARIVTLKTAGNWMIPEVHRQAVGEILQLLIEIDPAESLVYQQNANRYLQELDSMSRQIKAQFAGRNLPPVLAAEHQAPFLVWLGFRVVGTYGRAEDWTARELSRLARVIVDSGVGLIVDNLQSGPDAGRELARAAGIGHVTLSNFPLEGSYFQTLSDNTRRLAEVIR